MRTPRTQEDEPEQDQDEKEEQKELRSRIYTHLSTPTSSAKRPKVVPHGYFSDEEVIADED